jgi:IPT/TIG domain
MIMKKSGPGKPTLNEPLDSTEVKPTPTQEENDLAASGEHVIDKEEDGSPPDTGVDVPPDGGGGGGNGNGGNGGGSTALSITSISPTSGALPNVNLTVNGTNFNADCKVLFDGVVLDTTMVSDTQLTATANGAAAGDFNVRVDDTNTLTSSNVVQFTFTETAARGTMGRRERKT